LKRIKENKFNAHVTIIENVEAEPKGGSLGGLLISVKDIIYTKGIRTTAGSKILLNFIPEYDATVVKRIKDEGGIIISKTNTHEFAIGATNTSSVFGPVKNPHDPSRIAGGSSGGSAAAVAAGDVPVALGTDTGGSVRIPAALCGVIGFKPTFGRISRNGIIPMSWSLDHVGIIGKDVEVVKRVYEVIKGLDNSDPSTVVNLEGEVKIKEVRKIGVIKELTKGTDVEEDFWKFVQKFSSEFDIEEVSIPEIEQTARLRLLIAAVEAASYHSKFLPEYEKEYFPDVITFIKQGFSINGVEYVNALRLRTEMTRSFLKIFKYYQLLASPTVPFYPPKIDEVLGKEYEWRVKLTRNTAPFNFFENPAITIPASKFVGVQLVANLLQDEALLEFVGKLKPTTYIAE